LTEEYACVNRSRRTLVIDRLFAAPDAFDNVEILSGACIALIVIEIVPIPALISVIAAADDMNCDAPLAEVIERSQGARCKRRCHESGPMCQQHAEPRCIGKYLGRRHYRIGRGAVVRHEHSIESARLMGQRNGAV
jgi:hypothetical protein